MKLVMQFRVEESFAVELLCGTNSIYGGYRLQTHHTMVPIGKPLDGSSILISLYLAQCRELRWWGRGDRQN